MANISIVDILFLLPCSSKPVLLLNLQIPFCVVIGWMIGRPVDLNFQLFETATLFMTVLFVAFLLQVCISTTTEYGKIEGYITYMVLFALCRKELLITSKG